MERFNINKIKLLPNSIISNIINIDSWNVVYVLIKCIIRYKNVEIFGSREYGLTYLYLIYLFGTKHL